jgi:hypothetical protein
MSEPNFPTDALEQLLEKLREAQTRADKRAMVTHERFNVFTTLLKDSDEVRLHTRFLHCLLDPNGFHDCEDLFLKLFFETLADDPGKNHDNSQAEFNLPPDKTTWSVENEAYRGDFGRIDILLEQTSFGIAIENKIYHYEEKKQLTRYASYLESRRVPGLVIFLTLDGKPSTTHNGKSPIPYIRISYANHILAWLEKCLLKTCDIIPINQVLLQYRAVVLKLTGKNLKSYMKPIVEFIEKNSDIIRFGDQIREGIAEVRTNFLDWISREIIKELEKGGFKVTRHPDPTRPTVLFLTPADASVLKNAPFKVWIEYEPDITLSLLVHVVTEEFHYTSLECVKPQPVTPGLFERMNEGMRKCFLGDDCYDPTKTFGGVCPIGVYKIINVGNDECLAASLKTKDKSASDVCNRIRQYIKLLEKIYTEAKQETKTQP